MKQIDQKTATSTIFVFILVLFSFFSSYTAFTQVIAPNHFTTVWQGENGQNHMNFMVVSAILENSQLGANDEIAIFSGSLCVGAKKLKQSIIPGNSSTFISLTASSDDGTKNGYLVNDTIIFKIWDSKNQKEMRAVAVKYRNDIPPWLTSGKFSVGATAVVEIESFTEYTQSIPLISGTNLFSTYIAPTNPNLKVVMKPLCDLSTGIKVLDENSKSLEYSTTLKTWVNNIGSISKTEGYSINQDFNSTLNITGRIITLPLDIPLNLGWNFISYPRADQVNALSIVQPLITQKKLIKVQDEKGNTIEKVKGSWKNNIGNFVPGKAYKINVNSAGVLTILANYVKSGIITTPSNETVYFKPSYTGNGLDHMNIHLDGLVESGLSVGDELAAYDGEICVGTLKLTENHFNKNFASLISSSASEENNQKGFSSGHPIQLFAWNKQTGEQIVLQPELIEGELSYEKYASALVKLKSATTAASIRTRTTGVEIFPNPTHRTFTVRFSQLPEIGSTIEITDITGRKITSRKICAIYEEFDIGNEPAGLYFLKSNLGSKNIIQKLIIN
jgi:hypothetical protein